MTSAPIAWDDLRGRWVLLSFWTAGCEASLAHLTELEQLQSRHPELVVIAVHSPRAPYAADPNVVIETLARHRIRLRVVHDPVLETWSRYSPGGWPTAFLLDPRGKALGAVTGLEMSSLIDDALSLHSGLEQASNLPPVPPIQPASGDPSLGLLRWPSSVTMLSDGRIAVADSGNQRVLIGAWKATGEPPTLVVRQVVGSLSDIGGICGAPDGSLLISRPNRGSIIRIDLANRTPSVVAEGMRRPVGIAIDRDGSIVVADAGVDRILRIDSTGAAATIAGSGRTGRADGPAARAHLAQPSGIVRVGRGLAFVDRSTNNVRILTDKGRVVSVTDNSEVSFGLVDGPPHRARLHSPSSLTALGDGSLVVADTGNSRLRHITDRDLTTIGAGGLCRPEGLLTLPDQSLLVCDTGNHRLVRIDLATRTAVEVAMVMNQSPTAGR